MEAKFTFLGTGTSQGIPVIGCHCPVCHSSDPRNKRLRSSLLLEAGGRRLLIDAGPDLRQQLLRQGIEDIDAVLFTHEHQDHTAGLDELRAINFQQGHAVPLYVTEAVEARLRQQYAYVFRGSNYPGLPQLELRRLPQEAFNIGPFSIEALPAGHGNIEVQGFRFGKMAYLTDVNAIPATSAEKMQGLEQLTLGALRQERHHSHFSLSEALAWGERLAVKQLYLTHISHHMGLHQEVSAVLPRGAQLAEDGLSQSFNLQ